MSFVGLLQLLFIALKLMDYINWSWWVVLSPTIVSFLIVFIAATVTVVISRSK